MTDKKDLTGMLLAVLEQAAHKKPANYTEEEKSRAAYALNLCTVSVSQIINYNDINILEQEYETVLNNLNLENMPKDEALLNILKQILDTVTFFRISKGDKEFLDKEYQHKMQTAIWSAVPNFGLLIAGGSLKTMALSLASQVGIGYMNYRRARADAGFERERGEWQLERSAIEQLNGLRRELFDTAWRLAAEYEFPDEYRLTENQIEQYNTILMDTDPLRKYERLDSVKDRFSKYNPFWYHFGNTAAQIAMGPRFSDKTRERYRNYAIQHFETFCRLNDKNILREDKIASACALEYIDLLDPEKDTDKIKDLIKTAIKSCGSSNDILQLCAMAYLKTGDTNAAVPILRLLVNEDYNTIINAQFLSNIYVCNYSYKNDPQTAYSDYEILKTRVAEDYLFPFPYDGIYDVKEMETKFYKKQRSLLRAKYHIALSEFIRKYTIKYNQLFQTPEKYTEYPDSYFLDSAPERMQRLCELDDVLTSRRKKRIFCSQLSESIPEDGFFEIINDLYHAVETAGFMEDKKSLECTLANSIMQHGDLINKISAAADEGDCDTLAKLLPDNTFRDIVYDFFAELDNQLMNLIEQCTDMKSASELESKLRSFCIGEHLSDTDIIFDHLCRERKEATKPATHPHRTVFSQRLLGIEHEAYEREKALKKKLAGFAKEYANGQITDDTTKVNFLITGSDEFAKYFSKTEQNDSIRQLQSRTIAVIDDTKAILDNDLLLTMDGLGTISGKKLTAVVPYSNMKYIKSKEKLEGKGYDGADITKMISQALKRATTKLTDNTDSDKAFLTGAAVGAAASSAPGIITAPLLQTSALLAPGFIPAAAALGITGVMLSSIRQKGISYSNKNVKMDELYNLIKQLILELEKANFERIQPDTRAADDYKFLQVFKEETAGKESPC